MENKKVIVDNAIETLNDSEIKYLMFAFWDETEEETGCNFAVNGYSRKLFQVISSVLQKNPEYIKTIFSGCVDAILNLDEKELEDIGNLLRISTICLESKLKGENDSERGDVECSWI